MTKTLIATAALAAVFVTTTAQAEIWCEENRGCLETGKQIRLVHQRNETSVVSRDGKGRINMRGTSVVNDTPHQTAAPVRRR
jgi:hypothetical protein